MRDSSLAVALEPEQSSHAHGCVPEPGRARDASAAGHAPPDCRCGAAPAARHSRPEARLQSAAPRLARTVAKAPIHLYRWTLKPLIGWECRHLPTCSEYALDAIEINGAWRGLWLAASRISRCRPGGTHGFDPAPDIRTRSHVLAPWRYGRWR